MMARRKMGKSGDGSAFRDDSAKREFVVTAVCCMALAAPLFWYSWEVETKGAVAADVASYFDLVFQVNEQIGAAHEKLTLEKIDIAVIDDATDLERFNLTRIMEGSKGVVVPVEKPEPEPQEMQVEDIQVSGIIWNTGDPLVIVGRDVYRKGDEVAGCEVIKIDKTEVTLRCKDGGIVVKYFYEYLNENKKE